MASGIINMIVGNTDRYFISEFPTNKKIITEFAVDYVLQVCLVK